MLNLQRFRKRIDGQNQCDTVYVLTLEKSRSRVTKASALNAIALAA